MTSGTDANGMLRVCPSRKTRIIHVETELGIVNIYLGLRDDKGRRVETVAFKPDNYAGQKKVRLIGSRFVENLHVLRRKKEVPA